MIWTSQCRHSKYREKVANIEYSVSMFHFNNTHTHALFSVLTSHVIKIKIVTIHWKKSRVWDTIYDWYINNLAKNQVFLFVYHPNGDMEHKTWRPLSNRNICHWVLLLKRKIIALELRYIERNVSFSASTVQLAKTKVITHLLTYATAFSGHNFNVTQRKSLEIQTRSMTIRRTLSS